MKKILFSLLLFIPLFTIAQNKGSEEHLTFKDIPINGSIQEFVTELTRIGFKVTLNESSLAAMDGTFANKNCELIIGATSKSKKVYTILVKFNKSNSWYSLKHDYNEFKQLLQQKYHIKPDVTENFYDPYYEGDGYELQALKRDKCIYISTFKLINGEIVLYISDEVRIQYIDKINSGINKQEEKSNAYDDL